MMDTGIFVELHVKPDWSDHDKHSDEMVFKNAVFVLKNYARYGYRRVIANDFGDHVVRRLPVEFRNYRFVILSAVVQDERVLRRRIEARDGGFTHMECALAWNRLAQSRPLLPREIRLDTSKVKPGQVVRLAMRYIRALEHRQRKVSAVGSQKLPPGRMFVNVRDWFVGAKKVIPKKFK